MAKPSNVLQFAPVSSKHYTDRSQFLAAVQAVQEQVMLVDATSVESMDVDGNLDHMNARLTQRAFEDLCALTQTPESYVRRVAKRNEALAMDIMRDAFGSGLLKGCVLLVDTASNRVEGAVLEAKHNPPDVAELMRLSLSAEKGTRFMGGWIAGTSSRMCATTGEPVDVKTGKPAEVGDLMSTGYELMTDFGSPACTSITDYAERLICLNGMLARDQQHCEVRKHAGFEIDDKLLVSFLSSIERAKVMHTLARRATKHFFDGKSIKKVIETIAEGQHPAASVKLAEHAKKQAVVEAQRDCRKPGEICLWDFVNGVTDAAKHAPSLDRRRDIEHFGYALMCDVLEAG